ncbi:MAG TPA: hypothetical protein VGL97_23420 [Bryobacteraceae bacterium]|jgi:hypothetical protein
MAKTQKVKHPKDMITDEAIKHLFHPEVVKEAKRHVEELNRTPKKGATK